MQNTLLYFLTFLLLVLGCKASHSQSLVDYDDISIFFGDKQKSNANVERFMKTKSLELLCVQNQLSFFNVFSRNNSKYTFDFITDYTLPDTHPISFYGDGKNSSLTHYTILGDQVLGISSQTTFLNKGPSLYYHFINPYHQGKFNHGFSLNELFFFNNEIDLSRITLVSSSNKKYASMIYVQKTQSDEYTSINYLNFKDAFSKPRGGAFIYPFPSKSYELLDLFIQDEKTQYIVAGHFIDIQKKEKWITQDNFFKSITIGKIENLEFQYEKLEVPGKFFTEIGLYLDGEQIILRGLYSSFIDGSIEGTFTAQIDQSGEIKNKQFSSFSKEVANSIENFNTTSTNDYNTLRHEYKGFQLIEFHTVQDGYIGVAEFNALEYRYGGNDVPGATNTVDSYYWSNDLIVYKLNSKGEMEWSEMVPKYQRSINDGGYYLSTASYFDKDNIHLFFNDNLLNYNQDGSYNKNGDHPIAAQYNSNKNTIGHVSINLKDGQIQRKKTIGKEETSLIFVPLLSTAFPNTKKLMIYGRSGNKHRIGRISFRK